MRRAMEYVRWELDTWWTPRHGRERSIFTESKKVANFMWQSWKRGALFVLVLAFLPVLFPVALILSFVGFISSVPLLCGAATYYLFFRSFSLPSFIAEWVGPSKCELQKSPELNAPSERNHRIFGPRVEASSHGQCRPNEVIQVRGPLSLCPSARLKCHYPQRNDENSCNSCGTRDACTGEGLMREDADGSSKEQSKAGYRKARIDIIYLPEQEADAIGVNRTHVHSSPAVSSSGQHLMHFGTNEGSVGEPAADVLISSSEKNKLSAGISVVDVPLSGLLEEDIFDSVYEPFCTVEKRHMTEMDVTSDITSSHGSFMMEVREVFPAKESVLIEHTANTASVGESLEALGHFRGHAPNGKDDQAVNRVLTGKPEVNSEETLYSNMLTAGEEVKDWAPRAVSCVPQISVKCSSSPFSYSALPTSLEDLARADSESVSNAIRARHWREEVEDTVLSSPIARVPCMGTLRSEASDDVFSVKSFKSEPEKTMINDPDIHCLLGCAEESEIFSASQMLTSLQFTEKTHADESRGSGFYRRFASSPCTHQRRLNFNDVLALSPCTHQRRLSFNDILADDKRLSSGFSLPREKFNGFTPDCKHRSVSTSFCSDYTWPSESSEQDFELLSTRGTAYEESCVDTTSTVRGDEETEPGVVSDSPFMYGFFSPTSDQLTEDWETRRKRWEEESTPGRLVPFAPHMEAHSVEARSMCNPLFEFSTPSPPLIMLNTGDVKQISNSPLLHTRFSKRHSSEILRTRTWSADSTPCSHRRKLGKCKCCQYTKRFNCEDLDLTSTMRRHGRSYSTSFIESLEPDSDEFEGVRGYWWRTTHSLTSSPRDSSIATSPEEVAHRIREEISTIQMVIGQKIPPHYSLWKEVETLSQIIGLKLPYTGETSDLSRARQGLDLLKIVVSNRWDIEL